MIEATVLVVAALFPIVNPLGSAAIFVNLVGPVASSTQRLLAQKIAIYSFFLLLGSLLWGVHVLAFFGIAIYAVQIGGGLVVAATGWSLLNQDTGRAKTTAIADDEVALLDVETPRAIDTTHVQHRIEHRNVRSPLE